jgi:hypothetical protein
LTARDDLLESERMPIVEPISGHENGPDYREMLFGFQQWLL